MIRHAAALSLLAAAALAAPARAQSPDVEPAIQAAADWRAGNAPAIMAELDALLRIPNDAAVPEDIRANAQHLTGLFEARGFETEILEAGDAPVSVLATRQTPGAERTLMLYAHFDGQSVDRARWVSDPYDPVLMTARRDEGGEPAALETAEDFPDEWRLYARSASDDKAPIVAILAAIDALDAAGIAPSANLKIFLEGEEEKGSPNLDRLLAAHADKLAADVWIFADGPVDPSGDPRIIFGVRGVIGAELTVYGPPGPLHSGHYGNVAPNPAARLTHLVASMRDDEGHILIEDFPFGETPGEAAREAARTAHDDERMARDGGLAEFESAESYGESLMRPALNVLGLRAGPLSGAAPNAIPSEATAFLGVRLVSGQEIAAVQAAIARHVEAQGYQLVTEEPDRAMRAANADLAKLEWEESGYAAARTPLDLAVSERLIDVVQAATGDRAHVVPTLGGSLPISIITEAMDAPAIIIPMVNPDNNQHAPNENLRLGHLWDGIDLYAAIIAEGGEF